MAQKKAAETVAIAPLNFKSMIFAIRGTAPYVQHAFSEKARKKMLEEQMKKSGTKGGKGKKEPRNPEEEFRQAIHLMEDGRYGIPASGIRTAMIDVCRMVGYVMVKARMSVFCEADGFDAVDGQPLVALIGGDPEMAEHSVRLSNTTTSLAFRPMWRRWGALIKLRWDADQFEASDVTNLLHRAGMQVGIGEGRPLSKNSNGMGWGTFELCNKSDLDGLR